MKKKRTKKISLKQQILDMFHDTPYMLYNYKQMSKRIGIKDASGKRLVQGVMREMMNDKHIEEVKPGKYKLTGAELKKVYGNPKSHIMGIVDMKQTGKAFIISNDVQEDVFIASNNTAKALNGDTVKVFLFPQRKGKRPEGVIVKVIKRAKMTFSGIVRVANKIAFLAPDSKSMHLDILLPIENLNGAKDGQKAIAEIVEWPEKMRNPFGRVTAVLGYPGENEVEMQSILSDWGFPLFFPKEVLEAAEKISTKIPREEIASRRDYRNITCFTIDPHDAKDFDDALSIRKTKNNNWEIGVHIADVSAYVKEGSLIDKDAYERATSVYLVDRVCPMLPERLSNEICSLRAHEDKLCFSVLFELDIDGKVINKSFSKTIINSNRRFTYEEVQKIIDTTEGDYAKEISVLNEIAIKIRAERFKNGAIAFDREEVKFKLDENGKPIGIYTRESNESHKLIEEFMLLANRSVAEFIGKPGRGKRAKTFIYRVHDKPGREKLMQFSDFVAKFGYEINVETGKGISSSLNKLLGSLAGKGEQNIIEQLAIRTMEKALYTTENIGHYGLSFSHYTHFTSPIRRYPDLMVHRILHKYLLGEEKVNADLFEQKCKHCSKKEVSASKAEWESIKFKQVEFMKDKVGMMFDGVITGVSKWGIFVEAIETKCEGMVPLRELRDDYYYLDEENFCVVGQRSGNIYKLGDDIAIVVKKVDISEKKLEFMIPESFE